MSDWLAPVRAALDGLAGPVEVFFRDDDAGWDDAGLLALLEVFERRSLHIDVAVIPVELRPELGRALAERADCAGVRLHQHGYAHVNHEPGDRGCEFGAGRELTAQARDLVAGAARLGDVLGARVDRVFTPPWNRCLPQTAELLAELGFRVLSRDRTAKVVGLPTLLEIPITVDWSGTTQTVAPTRQQLAVRIAAALTVPGPTGVLFHHALIDGAEREAVDQLLVVLARHPHVRPTTIGALAAAA